MITAILLAAGRGQRMEHRPKALLEYAGQSFLVRSLQQLLASGVDETLVVTGAYREQLRPAFEDWSLKQGKPAAREVFNADFSQGLLASIQAGIRACDPQTKACLITLVDLPLLDASDYREQMEIWRDSSESTIVRAVWNGRPGHPVTIPAMYFPQILHELPGDRGCAFLMKRHPNAVRQHIMKNGHGATDIDTLEDYHAHLTS